MTIIKLTGDRQREYAIDRIMNAPDGYCVRIGEETRSIAQNAKLHALCGDIRNQVPDMAQYTVEQVKLRFMDAFGSEVTYLPKLEGAGMFPVSSRTSTLSKTQFAGLIEIIHHYGAKRGVVWSEQNPYEERI